MTIKLKRAYDPPSRTDGLRVLVDRVWPRGLTKDDLHITFWAKEAAPSTELRKWFGHDPQRLSEFRKRYEAELKQPAEQAALAHILEEARKHATLTLVYGAKDETHNQAIVLKDVLEHSGA